MEKSTAASCSPTLAADAKIQSQPKQQQHHQKIQLVRSITADGGIRLPTDPSVNQFDESLTRSQYDLFTDLHGSAITPPQSPRTKPNPVAAPEPALEQPPPPPENEVTVRTRRRGAADGSDSEAEPGDQPISASAPVPPARRPEDAPPVASQGSAPAPAPDPLMATGLNSTGGMRASTDPDLVRFSSPRTGPAAPPHAAPAPSRLSQAHSDPKAPPRAPPSLVPTGSPRLRMSLESPAAQPGSFEVIEMEHEGWEPPEHPSPLFTPPAPIAAGATKSSMQAPAQALAQAPAQAQAPAPLASSAPSGPLPAPAPPAPGPSRAQRDAAVALQCQVEALAIERDALVQQMESLKQQMEVAEQLTLLAEKNMREQQVRGGRARPC